MCQGKRGFLGYRASLHSFNGVSFFRSVGVLTAGTIISQLLILAAAPVLTRLYSPAAFGVLGVYAGLASMLATAGCASYDSAISYARDEASAVALARLSLVIIATTASAVAILGLYGADAVLLWLNLAHAIDYTWALPLTILSQGCFQISHNYLLRSRAYVTVGTCNIIQSAATLSAQMAFAFIQTPAGIILGYVVGRVAAAAAALRAFPALRQRWSTEIAGARKLGSIAVEYRKFPAYITWSSLLNQASTLLPVFVMATFFGVDAAGLFALSQRVLQMPAGFVSASVGKVFISLAHDPRYRDAMKQLTEMMVRVLALLGVPSFSLLVLIAPQLFSFAFGPTWYEAGVYAQWLTPWLVLTFVSSPLSAILPVFNKQEHELGFQIVLLVARGSALATGVLYESPLLAVKLFGLASAGCWACFLFYSLQLVGHRPTAVCGWLFREITVAAAFLFPVAATVATISEPYSNPCVLVVVALCSLSLATSTVIRLIRIRKDGAYLR